MYDLAEMSIADMTECGRELRSLGRGASSMEEVAGRVVSFLYQQIGSGTKGDGATEDGRAAALVRFFKTHDLGDLGPRLQAVAEDALSGEAPRPDMKCLTLLATAGDEPDWNSRLTSQGHQTIPLPSPAVLQQFPMVSQLVQQLGVDVSTVIQPNPDLIVDLQEKTFNVFFVPDARGSPHVPAQEGFVIPFSIRSVLGFGGILPSGDLFAIIMFTKVHIEPMTAVLFEPLALSVKLALLPFANGPFFNGTD